MGEAFLLDRAEIVAEARSWIGTRYRHQQSLKGVGCDCLGLVRGVWRAVIGTEPEPVPAYSPDWAEPTGAEFLLQAAQRHLTPLADPRLARPGDVLLFRWKPHLPAKHCAILVWRAMDPSTCLSPSRLDGRVVHAYDAAGRVAEGNLPPSWADRVTAALSFPGVE